MFNISNSNNSEKKPIFPYIEIPVVAGCNLKCNNCSFFCNYIDENFYVDIEELRKDIKELSKKIDIKRIRILGGEPLLHPEVCNILVSAREIFPESEICIVTNGILLPQMGESFWKTLIDERIALDISYYPIWGDDFSKIIDLLNLYNIKNYTVKNTQMFSELLNVKGDSDIKKTHRTCVCKEWINLWNHKLYPCTNAFRVFYNKKFNTNLEIPEGYDIYKTKGRELYNKLIANPKPSKACRFCKSRGRMVKWSRCEDNKNGIDNNPKNL